MTRFIDAVYAAGGEIYEVGGCVRDELLGHPGKDLDVVVCHLPLEKLKSLLRPFGRVSLVGKSFGVLKFKPSDEDHEYDIALPRKESSTGVGHRDFEVDFDPELPLVLDLGRRDFTVNAMARSLKTGELIDPFGGQRDLDERILRQVFKEAFEEDPLRLMRAVQFSARFNLIPEPETLAAMRTHAPLIAHVSPERIIEEVRKLFLAEKPSIGFRLMREVGLLEIVFPLIHDMIGVQQPRKDEDVFDHTMKVFDASRHTPEMNYAGDVEVMFAALFHDAGKPKTKGFDEEKQQVTFYGHQIVSTRLARKWMKKYRIETIGVDPTLVLNLIEHHMFETKSFFSDRALRRFIRKVGPDQIVRLLDLRIADKKGGRFPNKLREIMKLKERVICELEKKPPLGPKDLAINGHDLMTLAVPPGPRMGQIIYALVDMVVDHPEFNTKEYLIEWVKTHCLDNQAIAWQSQDPPEEPTQKGNHDESDRESA